MKLMIGRIQSSAIEYPKFALLVVCVYLVGAMLTPVIFAGNTLRSVLLWTGVGLVAVFALDILSYIWIVADDGRVRWFTEMVNDYEGKNDEDDCDGECPLRAADERYEAERDVRGPSLWDDEEGQDIAEYAVMLAVMLVIVIGTIHLIGSSAGNVFSSIGSKIGGQ
jgi:Flp pilus assembly pilin Flp